MDKGPFLQRKLVEQLMFGAGRIRRFTQDSPVLPDVWLEYALGPGDRSAGSFPERGDADPAPAVELLVTPFQELPSGEVRQELQERLAVERGRIDIWKG